jgi:cytochrome b6-f complex iron-sulfur subunit
MAQDVRQRDRGLFYPGAEAAREIERRAASPHEGGAGLLPRRRGLLNRRSLFRWTGWGTIMLLLGQASVGTLDFFWPRKVGTFGGQVNAGAVDSLQVGDVKLVQEGKFYLSRVPEGILALWWKCPHLGCTVPWKPDDPTMDDLASKGRFNCGCHGSIYNRYGQIVQGPAPRPMDLFGVEIRDGRIFVNTSPTQVKTRAVAQPSDATPV